MVIQFVFDDSVLEVELGATVYATVLSIVDQGEFKSANLSNFSVWVDDLHVYFSHPSIEITNAGKDAKIEAIVVIADCEDEAGIGSYKIKDLKFLPSIPFAAFSFDPVGV